MVFKYKDELKECKSKSKFSLVFDEWTSAANKRYLNATLLSKNDFWNLGLIRIRGSATSQNLLDLIKKHLEFFELSFEQDIACIVTDSCNVMKRIGSSISQVKQQLCMAHAIQLSVLQILYNLPKTASDMDDRDFDTGYTCSSDEEKDCEEDEIECGRIDFDDESYGCLDVRYFPLIQKVRSTIFLFCKSPKNNDVLQLVYNARKILQDERLHLESAH